VAETADVTLTRISTPEAPAPAGHYSQAAAWKDLVFVSGQLAKAADGRSRSGEPFADQARQAIANVLAILRAAGGGPETVLKVTAYIVGIENWPTFNQAFAEAFGAAKPARAVVPVPALNQGYLVEVEAVAVRR
jgi:2-iminobutanoate/2-iminopropanoate deaminase